MCSLEKCLFPSSVLIALIFSVDRKPRVRTGEEALRVQGAEE